MICCDIVDVDKVMSAYTDKAADWQNKLGMHLSAPTENRRS